MKVKTSIEHKRVLHFLWLITYIIFFPFAILSLLYDLLEVIFDFVSNIRCKMVYRIMEFLYERGNKDE